MASSSSPARAPNRSQRNNSSFYEYETRPSDLARDRGFFESADGQRAFQPAHNIGVKRRHVNPSDLVDAFGDWVPLPGDAEGELDIEDSLPDADLGDKRKRYLSSFRCTDCGVFVQCLDCVLSRHSLTPLHRVKEWNGTFWVPTTLMKLGLIYQLGHGGHLCCCPAPKTHEMAVMDTEAIHTVQYRYCGCDKADRANNLEQLMRNEWYPATTYSFAKRAKRAGRGHDPTGLDGTVNGECALLCWPCPHDEKNLPKGWQDVAPEFQFLYMLILALDTNFRLKSRLRANERDNPPLGDGWGYIMEEAPYKEHLRNYVAEKDVSTCIAFAALLQKDTRLTTGRRSSMRAARGCAYANMDYILPSTIIGITALYLAVSYDIACQWQINLPKRLESMPDHLKINLVLITLLFALPVWHAGAHEESCQTENLLTYLDGVGRTDGEGIERTWSVLNPISWATKEMGRGAHADAIEDKIDHHNWEKNINQGANDAPVKLILAIDKRDRQVTAFKEVDQTLSKNVRKEWRKKIDDWKADRTKPNPYLIGEGKNNGPSEATIRLALTKDKAEEAATGGGKLHGSSVTSFLVAGLQLEEAQQRIKSHARGRVLLAADQQERIQEMRIAFFSKLKWRCRSQAVYISAAVRELEEEEDARDPDLPPPNAEDVRLYLPSGLQRADHEEGCRPGLPAMEGKLREGQCCDSLRVLHSRLHAKRHLLNYHNESVVGQRAATRAYTLIERIRERVDAVSGKYRRARAALIALRGRAVCEGFRELKASDIQLNEEREVNARAQKRLSKIGSRPCRKGPALSSKDKVFSWIWTAGGGPGEDEAALHDSKEEKLAVRVE
ncbi:hypothetical protein B0H16DRAFT_1664977 [Mycena metata]|uniref:CxC2-like cysteine cluster KDZ transposase-associated domain-containing protein n=1 Tax=Mycena metata TaxID=1033252 RepID=A0AAD7I5W5_9AGAR|nr:hypothetical protein B0H16DRAFT_1664977 [Mycena metata]